MKRKSPTVLVKYSHCTSCGKEKTTHRQRNSAVCAGCKTQGGLKNRGQKRPRTIEYRINQSIAQGGDGVLGKKRLRIPGLGEWTDAVKARDGACIDCGSTERLEAHHLVLKSKFPEVATELWNGITLCRKCHIAEHKIIGKK